MERSFKKWLVSRDVTPKGLSTLKKKNVTNYTTLKAMRDSDLNDLELPVGQCAILRSARDELIQEGAQASSKENEDRFEQLHPPPEAGEVGREVRRKDAPVLSPVDPSRHGGPKRLRGNEIREKYKLPDKYRKSKEDQEALLSGPTARSNRWGKRSNDEESTHQLRHQQRLNNKCCRCCCCCLCI